MTEKVLEFDTSIIPQETGYNCGPASAQICLNIRGVYVDEWTLAQECGTDEGGTDWVGMIEGSLDSRLPDANYTSVMALHDPPTQQDKDRFWDGLVRSIDNGYGVIMNWVAPPSNYPVGIKGSPNPSYGGGTVFHYVSATGYDDAGARAVFISDSGFWPWQYWISFDQCCSLIPPKALCYANLQPAIPEEEVPNYDALTYEQLCGPIDPDTGYGTGWPQNGQNEDGQNLYLVDLLSQVLAIVDPDAVPSDAPGLAAAFDAPDYSKLNFEQLSGPWPQLANLSVNDALVHIKEVLAGGPPFHRTGGMEGTGSLGGSVQAVVQPSSPSAEPGPPPEPDSPPT